jgi:peptidoglycan hydrolase-like protein with peptidoglycan-binding domain
MLDLSSILDVERSLNILAAHGLAHLAGPVMEDGVFGGQLVAALRAFQRQVYLPATGQLDAATRGMLGQALASVGVPSNAHLTSGYATGQVRDRYAKAQADVDRMDATLDSLELGGGEITLDKRQLYSDRILAYKRAGQFGADVIGPEIDAAGAPATTQPLTHHAWDLNRRMHTEIGPQDYFAGMMKARQFAADMVEDYRHAIEAGRTVMQNRPVEVAPLRPLHSAGYAVGQVATADAVARVQALVDQMASELQQIEPGASFGKYEYTSEVQGLQSAGQFGASSVGPAIDALGAAQVTQPMTHQAWVLNGQLHALQVIAPALGPGYGEMRQAHDLAWSMLRLYQAAFQTAKQTLAQTARVPTPSPAPARPTASSKALQAAANDLLAAIHTATQAGQPVRWSREHGQARVMWKPTGKFQRTYNAATHGHLTVDGIFGPETATALQSVVGPKTSPTPPPQATAGAGWLMAPNWMTFGPNQW